MSFDESLGFLGLLGIAVLILIYLIRPNYQQKIVSSTLIWKLSLKYRKKRLPINRFRNLLILICQILIITLCAFVLAQPYLPNKKTQSTTEKIVVLDASASMLAHMEGSPTRFERAVSKIKEMGNAALSRQEKITLILANEKASSILLHEESQDAFESVLDTLVEKDKYERPNGCTFGIADINGAMELADNYLRQNSEAEIILYTATNYENEDNDSITIVNVAVNEGDISTKEWNAAIVDCRSVLEDGYYRFSIDVACYNLNDDIKVNIVAYGVNGVADSTKSDESMAKCRGNAVYTVKFNNLQVNSFVKIYIYITADDSFPYDNNYYIFGSHKEELKVIYVSPYASIFYKAVLSSLPNIMSNRWEIKSYIYTFEELEEKKIQLNGYDFYIFEYVMPSILPADGAVLLVCPDKAPENSGFNVIKEIDKLDATDPNEWKVYPAESSPLMHLINTNDMFVRRYQQIAPMDASYKILMNIKTDGLEDPLFMYKNTSEQKIAVISYASFYSDLTVTTDFIKIIYNIFDCFFPASLKDYSYEIGETFIFSQTEGALKESSPMMVLTNLGTAENELYNAFPYSISSEIPGEYRIMQKMHSQREVYDYIFVRVAASESDFAKVSMFISPVALSRLPGDFHIFIYFVAALCALLFVERLLHAKEEF